MGTHCGGLFHCCQRFWHGLAGVLCAEAGCCALWQFFVYYILSLHGSDVWECIDLALTWWRFGLWPVNRRKRKKDRSILAQGSRLMADGSRLMADG